MSKNTFPKVTLHIHPNGPLHAEGNQNELNRFIAAMAECRNLKICEY